MRDKASRAENYLRRERERKRGENNYNNGNKCETVYLDERKPSGKKKRRVTIKLNNYCVEPPAWKQNPPK